MGDIRARLANIINQIIDVWSWFDTPADRLWAETTSRSK